MVSLFSKAVDGRMFLLGPRIALMEKMKKVAQRCRSLGPDESLDSLDAPERIVVTKNMSVIQIRVSKSGIVQHAQF